MARKPSAALTDAEAAVMAVVWRLRRASVGDVVAAMNETRAVTYSTVQTILRILETKGFVGHEAFGKAHQYFPLINKEEYKRHATEKLLGNYFENSVESMFSFFVKEEKLDLNDVDEILKMIKDIKNRPR